MKPVVGTNVGNVDLQLQERANFLVYFIDEFWCSVVTVVRGWRLWCISWKRQKLQIYQHV